MKILMTKSWEAPEYLDDGLLHGLRALYGNSVVDSPRMWHMYADSFGPDKHDIHSIVGRGYTMYGMLDDSTIDRTDIETKIKLGYFDLILCHSWYLGPYHDLIIKHTPPRKIVWLDGRDERQVLPQFIGTGWYFKRELPQDVIGVKPISFGFPLEKIQQHYCEKIRAIAPCVAGDPATYVFKTEQEYYTQYNESLFGITKCKGGWDCMRHYEIIGSQCVPWFVDIAFCPITTCTSLPKNEFRIINNMINVNGADAIMHGTLREEYEEVRNRIHLHFVKNCTTVSLAKYVIDSTK